MKCLRKRNWQLKWLAAGFGLACVAGALQANEPKKAISQYVRERWGSDQGLPSGHVYAIAQTSDGYLWIGMDKGLVRFDGLKFGLLQRLNGTSAPIGPVLGLTADSEGNLWVRLQGARLLRYNGGKFEDASTAFEQPEVAVTAMCPGKDGEVMFSGLKNGIVRSTADGFLKLASTPPMPNFLVISMAEMADGRIYLGTRDTGLFQVSGGQISAGPRELLDRKVNCLLPSDKQALWIGTDSGLERLDAEKPMTAPVPRALTHAQVLAIGKDGESNIWVGTFDGLFRIDSAGLSSRDEEHSASKGGVTAIFEDREDNVWIGSGQGLERFRDAVFTTYSIPEGLPSESNGPVYVDSDGRTWFAPSEGGLYWLKEGVVGRIKDAGLDGDVVYSVTGGDGELWVGRQRGGLTRLQYRNGTLTSETYTQAQGLSQNSVYAVHRNHDATVWAATLSGGVSKLKDGKFTNYTAANGLLSNSVASITESSDGTMGFATPKGLSSFSNGRWQAFTQKDGLPSEDVMCLLADSTGTLWLGTARGIAAIRSGNVWTLEEAPDSLREPIFGIEEDRNRNLWIATANRVLRVDRDRLLRGKLGGEDLREYGLADGLRGTEGVKRNSSVVADRLGRIWFSMNRGISFVDPARAIRTSVPALVHIEGMSADGSALNIQEDLRIPAGRQRVTFSYAGLSLVGSGTRHVQVQARRFRPRLERAGSRARSDVHQPGFALVSLPRCREQ